MHNMKIQNFENINYEEYNLNLIGKNTYNTFYMWKLVYPIIFDEIKNTILKAQNSFYLNLRLYAQTDDETDIYKNKDIVLY